MSNMPEITPEEIAIYDGLCAISFAALKLEDALTAMEKIDPAKLRRVIQRFHKEIDEYDAKTMHDDAYNTEQYAHDFIEQIEAIRTKR